MAKERSPNKEIAFEMYKESNGEIQLKDIAAALGVKEGTVRVWKNRNKWDEKIGVTLQIKSVTLQMIKNTRNPQKPKVTIWLKNRIRSKHDRITKTRFQLENTKKLCSIRWTKQSCN